MRSVVPAGLPVLLLVLSVLAGCAGAPPEQHSPPAVAPAAAPFPANNVVVDAPAVAPEAGGRSWVLSCEWLAPFAVRPLADGGLRVEMPLRDVDLPRVEAASGERYAAAGIEVWLKGGKALYRGAGETADRECTTRVADNPWTQAALRGASFRALGQEPGWLVEIVPQRWLRILVDYGQRRLLLPPVAAQRNGNVLRYESRTAANAATLVIEQVPCRDVMSGAAFDNSVTLWLDGQEYRGCGQALP